MNTVWRFLKVFVLGTWVGSTIFFGFAAGVLFSQLKNLDQAGNIVGILLWSLHILGICAAVIYLVVSMIQSRSWRGLVRPASILVDAMLLATLFSEVWVIPTMNRLQQQMGSYMNTAATSPLRQQFDHWHYISVRIESGILVVGIVALFLTVWQKTKAAPRNLPPRPAPPASTGVTAPPKPV